MKKELVILKNGKMLVTSLELVEEINAFREKEENKAKLEHKDLLKIIRDEFEEEIGRGEISLTSYKSIQNKKLPMFELTTSQAKQILARESKLVRKALIAAIERAEDLLREKQTSGWRIARLSGKKTRQYETDAIRDKLIPLAIEQGSRNYGKFYMNYSMMINSLLKINNDMRDKLPFHYLTTIDMLERIIENIISAEVDKGTFYKDIYHVCKAKCQIVADLSFLPKLEVLTG